MDDESFQQALGFSLWNAESRSSARETENGVDQQGPDLDTQQGFILAFQSPRPNC